MDDTMIQYIGPIIWRFGYYRWRLGSQQELLAASVLEGSCTANFTLLSPPSAQ